MIIVPKCNVEKYLYHNEGMMICPKCGELEHILLIVINQIIKILLLKYLILHIKN